MELTLEELEALEPGSYTLLDLRSEQETAYGTIPGSVPANAAALPEGLPAEPGRIVLFCTRGKLSLETAERLRDEGFDACSLKGGYLAWLMRQMQRQEAEELCSRVENSLRKRFRLKLWCNFTKAIRQYELVKPNDRIAVCMSGGKDSMLMAKLFQELQRYTKFPFSVEYLVMDPGYSPENRRVIEENARKLNIPIHIFESNIFDYVYNVDKSPCYLCARMRRGHLYDYARRLGCNKIALGHHYDDVIETILMGMLYGAQGADPAAVSDPRGRYQGLAGRKRAALHPVRLPLYRHLHNLLQSRDALEAAGDQGSDPHAEAAQSGCGGAYFPLRGECESRHRHRLEDRRKKIQLPRPL